jgi:uncharacterized C2H2 Zn-finger protein
MNRSKKFRMKINDNPTDNNNNELLICDVCGRSFKAKGGLTRHSQAHSSTSKYSCQLCKATFANKGHYEGHINSHNNIKLLSVLVPQNFALNHRY